MKVKFAIIAVITLSFLVAGVVVAQPGDTGRFFVSAESDFGLGAAKVVVGTSHHQFENGFSADLAPGQVKALEVLGSLFGVTVEPVELYHVSGPPGKCSPWPSCKDDGGGGGGDVSRPAVPSDQTPWGIEKIYNNSAIVSTSGGAGVDVAVLDTGVNKNHLDLSRRVAQCKDFTKGMTIRNGCGDNYGHGTHVAGTILADGGADGLGIYGVASEAKLLAYKVCGNDGSCWADDIAVAIRYAADNGAEVVSMSLGGDSESSLIRDAVSYAVSKELLVVAAAGNDGPGTGSIDYPGAGVNVVAVGAIDSAEAVPDWSSRGVNDGDYVIEEREVEFGAPGVAVESTWSDGGYRVISGTSMATPHVSGLAAKVWQGSGSATRAYLQILARDIWIVGDDTATGFGLPTL